MDRRLHRDGWDHGKNYTWFTPVFDAVRPSYFDESNFQVALRYTLISVAQETIYMMYGEIYIELKLFWARECYLGKVYAISTGCFIYFLLIPQVNI